MTIFVKSKGDWFSSTGSSGVEGESLFMSSLTTSTRFPQPVDSVQQVDFKLDKSYTLSRDKGRSEKVYFNGMFADHTLQFAGYTTNDKVIYLTDLSGKGQGFRVIPDLRALSKGDKFSYGGQEALVLETDSELTVLLIADHFRVFSTAFLLGEI